MNGEAPLEGFDAMVALAEEQKVVLEAEREELQAQLGQNGDKLRAVNAILKTLNPSEAPASNGRSRKKKDSAAYTPSSERKEALVAWLSTQEGDITHQIVLTQFGWSSWHTQQMIAWARDAGLIRLSATLGNLKVYRSLVGKEV